jgi:hypothetical protein
MDIRRYITLVAIGLCLLAGRVTAQSPGPDDARSASSAQQAVPLRITTDTAEYCGRLVKQVETYQDPPDEVRVLLVEGRRMCGDGHVIGGVARLRRAVNIMRGETDQP